MYGSLDKAERALLQEANDEVALAASSCAQLSRVPTLKAESRKELRQIATQLVSILSQLSVTIINIEWTEEESK